MRRRNLAGSAALVALMALVACDTVTDLGEVRMEGTWDGVGALQAETGGLSLNLQQVSDGSFTGTWRLEGSSGLTGPVTQGMNQDGAVEFTMVGFHGQTVQFSGALAHAYRLEGTMTGYELDGLAVFRKGPSSN